MCGVTIADADRVAVPTPSAERLAEPTRSQRLRYKLRIALREPTTIIGILAALLFTYLIVVPILSMLTSGDLGRSLVGLLDAGRERRASVKLSIDPKARPPGTAVERALVQLSNTLAADRQPKQAATVTVINRGSGTLITVLGAADSLDPVALARLRSAGVAVSHAPGSDEDWVEIAWQATDGSTSP